LSHYQFHCYRLPGTLRFFAIRSEILKVLCPGAHGKDIEIGYGGTILELIQSAPEIEESSTHQPMPKLSIIEK
jgi:hypothetical protein